MTKKIVWSVVSFLIVVVLVLMSCTPKAVEEEEPLEEEQPPEEEEVTSDTSAALPPDPHVKLGRLDTPQDASDALRNLWQRMATQYHWEHGVLYAATVYVIVENRGGPGLVDVIFEVANEEVARETVHLESGEEKQISTTIPLSEYRYESAQQLKLNVTASPAQ